MEVSAAVPAVEQAVRPRGTRRPGEVTKEQMMRVLCCISRDVNRLRRQLIASGVMEEDDLRDGDSEFDQLATENR